MTGASSNVDIVEVATRIVASYVSYNNVPLSGLPVLIGSVHAATATLGKAVPSPEAKQETKEPAISIRKSVTQDYLICLEDGKKFSSLKRHLRMTYNLTPGEYRAKWGLPSTYPMVAPRYAARRSAIAKEVGLGMHRRERKGVRQKVKTG